VISFIKNLKAKINKSHFYFSCKHFTNQHLKAWLSLDQIRKEIKGEEVLVGPVMNISFAEKLVDLEKLYLDRVGIQELANNLFEGLTSLAKLHLSYNRLANLDNKPFQGLSNLSILILSGNQLVQLGNKPFERLKNLIHLDLNYNQMNTVVLQLFAPYTVALP
jgi:Leucine-rich repeat (LRR) protein